MFSGAEAGEMPFVGPLPGALSRCDGWEAGGVGGVRDVFLMLLMRGLGSRCGAGD